MSKFDDLWKFAEDNTLILAQEKRELEYIFNLMDGCESYLEIGTSEGNSLYILGNALKERGSITYIDRNEGHTREWRKPKEKILMENGYEILAIHGDTHHEESIRIASGKKYDCVLIDAGHRYEDAIQDARNYAPLANKYVFFHDIRMPEVMNAFLNYLQESNSLGTIIVNSVKYGFGVIKK